MTLAILRFIKEMGKLAATELEAWLNLDIVRRERDPRGLKRIEASQSLR
jgi:hypothetical protein